MPQQLNDALTDDTFSCLGKKLPHGLFIQGMRIVDRLNQSTSAAQYWHLTREFMTETIDRPNIEGRIV